MKAPDEDGVLTNVAGKVGKAGGSAPSACMLFVVCFGTFFVKVIEKKASFQVQGARTSDLYVQ